MKSLAFIAFTGLLALPFVNASAQAPAAQPAAPAAAPAPQLIVSGDQWVVQLPPGATVPQSITLQLSTPTSAPTPGVVIQQPATAAAPTTVAVPQQPSETVYVSEAPPAPPVEVIPVAPDHFHVWIAGHYEWTHHGYVWRVGHWERPPRHGLHWAPARWEFRGGRYVYIQGRWY
jgi:hypothetical protein